MKTLEFLRFTWIHFQSKVIHSLLKVTNYFNFHICIFIFRVYYSSFI